MKNTYESLVRKREEKKLLARPGHGVDGRIILEQSYKYWIHIACIGE
jgi:hypothetical protein